MAVLLGVSFFAALSSPDDFDTKVEELTAAMLATIALYFATSKPKCDDLTILDRAFRMSYILIGGLLATILVCHHLAASAYGTAMQAWLVVFPAVIVWELMIWRGMIRNQARAFRQIEHSADS
jgi:hypothetical protein